MGAPSPAPAAPVRDNPGGHSARPDHGSRRRPVPPDSTSAEAFYYVKQMNARTPMVVVLDSGEQLRGHIEWYDRNCIKVNREGAPNLLVFKHAIKYVFKQEEEGGSPSTPQAES
jgi:RNA chaperone Hfq